MIRAGHTALLDTLNMFSSGDSVRISFVYWHGSQTYKIKFFNKDRTMKILVRLSLDRRGHTMTLSIEFEALSSKGVTCKRRLLVGN
jgi:retron-type reverse transcriptase